MQIVIDIPKYIVDMCNECGCVIDADTEKVGKAIKNGTPLPKGHGRLIYAKDVGEYLTLADVPTIIEADTESEEE